MFVTECFFFFFTRALVDAAARAASRAHLLLVRLVVVTCSLQMVRGNPPVTKRVCSSATRMSGKDRCDGERGFRESMDEESERM